MYRHYHSLKVCSTIVGPCDVHVLMLPPLNKKRVIQSLYEMTEPVSGAADHSMRMQ